MNILCISGKKTSGKNTGFNFLLGLEMIKSGIVQGSFKITEDGKLFITDLFGDKEFEGIFDIDRQNDVMTRFNNEYIYPIIKPYSFADKLKKGVCMDLLGLTYEQCYGTNEQKNSLTKLKWDNMPGVTTVSTPKTKVNADGAESLRKYYEKVCEGIIYKPSGYMTAREVIQFVGTEIFRKMYGDVWINATIKQIQEDRPLLAVITDCRFPNEVYSVQDAGGKVVRLTRNIHEDTHESEVALDEPYFKQEDFDHIIDNQNMDISEYTKSLYEYLYSLNWIDKIDNNIS